MQNVHFVELNRQLKNEIVKPFMCIHCKSEEQTQFSRYLSGTAHDAITLQ